MRLPSVGRRSERGAALVEFAVVMPLLILLLFGIMEAGWFFAQQVEVRNAAREGARIAAVSAPDITGDGAFTLTDVIARTCDTLDLSSGSVQITTTASGAEVGDTATIQVTSTYDSLTSLLDPIFGGLTIDTDVEFRLEQPRDWSPGGPQPCP